MSAVDSTVRILKKLVHFLIDPLRIDDEEASFTLGIPEAQTTTVDSVQGWSKRPPAVIECPGCGADIYQARSTRNIDCPECHRTFKSHDFPDMKLVGLICPRCTAEMKHGIRHPSVFDIPEWATCQECQFHWDLTHWYGNVSL